MTPNSSRDSTRSVHSHARVHYRVHVPRTCRTWHGRDTHQVAPHKGSHVSTNTYSCPKPAVTHARTTYRRTKCHTGIENGGWLGSVVARALHSRVQLPAGALPGSNCGQVVHTHAPLTPSMQYNSVPAKGRWCSAAGKVTVGLASHWPCVTDFSGLSTYGLTAWGREMSTPPTAL